MSIVANYVRLKKLRPRAGLSFRNLARRLAVAYAKWPLLENGRVQEGRPMRKPDLDHLLETAVAKALGVAVPRHLNRRRSPARKPVQRATRRAA